jgi:hypothetical protein
VYKLIFYPGTGQTFTFLYLKNLCVTALGLLKTRARVPRLPVQARKPRSAKLPAAEINIQILPGLKQKPAPGVEDLKAQLFNP